MHGKMNVQTQVYAYTCMVYCVLYAYEAVISQGH